MTIGIRAIYFGLQWLVKANNSSNSNSGTVVEQWTRIPKVVCSNSAAATGTRRYIKAKNITQSNVSPYLVVCDPSMNKLWVT
jgi:hypothetical protein